MRSIAAPILALALAAAPAAAHGGEGNPSAMFQAYQQGNVPERFKNRTNPRSRSPEDFRVALELYRANCAACHGANAEGKGELAQVMEERPADLRRMLRRYPNADGYYFWIVSAGGAGFGISMPGYERLLGERDVWRLVNWMRAGFPGVGGDGDGAAPKR